MKKMQIMLNDIAKLKAFERIMANCPFEADVRSSENTRHVVDAKSIMGIFSLDVSKPVWVEAYCSQEEADVLFPQLENL